MDNSFLQQQAANDGIQRDPVTGMLTRPMAPAAPLFQGPVGAKTLMAQDPAALMLQALQQQAEKRKKNQWPENADVVHPSSGEVLTTGAVRD